MGSTLNAYVEFASEVNLCCGSETLELAKKVAKRNEVDLTKHCKRLSADGEYVFVDIEFSNTKTDTKTAATIRLD